MSLLLERVEIAEARFDKGLDRLEAVIKDIQTQFDGRVDQLEQFHLRLEEREKTLVAARHEKTEASVRRARLAGIGGAVIAGATALISAVRSVVHWP